MQIITDCQALDEFLSHAMTQKYVACDTEFVRVRTYFPDLALIQLATTTRDVLIDPLEVKDLSGLKKLFESKKIIKIFHAPRQDLEILRHDFNFRPVNIFDSQIAAALYGLQDQIGYEGLVKEFLDVQLDKSSQFTNWLERPLSEEQLTYAANDVTYLIKVYEKMMSDMGTRFEWARDLSRSYENDGLFETDLRPLYYKWANRVKNENQRVKLWSAISWREERAIQVNRPRPWILKDKELLDYAKEEKGKFPSHLDDFVSKHQSKHLKIVRQMNKDKVKSLSAKQRNALKELKKTAGKIAEECKMPLRYLASKEDFDYYIRSHDVPSDGFDWQYTLLWKAIRDFKPENTQEKESD